MNNNYSTPASSLVEGAGQSDNLQAGIAGDYQLAIGDVISEAWQRTKGIKRYVLGAGILLYVALIVAMLVLGGAAGLLAGDSGATSVIFGILVQLVIWAFMLPFMAGIFVMCLKHIQGQAPSFGDLFACVNKTPQLLITFILMYIMLILGFLLLIIPGIYLSFAYLLAVPLVIDRGLGPWEALEASRKAITKKWFTVFGFYIVLMIIMVVSMIPLGIGLIWTMPMMAVAFAILYRQVFGIANQY